MTSESSTVFQFDLMTNYSVTINTTDILTGKTTEKFHKSFKMGTIHYMSILFVYVFILICILIGLIIYKRRAIPSAQSNAAWIALENMNILERYHEESFL